MSRAQRSPSIFVLCFCACCSILCSVLAVSPLTAVELPWAPASSVEASFTDPEVLEAVDLDGDGDVDLVGGGVDGLAWWRNDGGSWSLQTVDAAFAALDLAVADVDRDGDLDLAAVSAAAVRWWANGGGGASWTAGTVAAQGARGVDVADLDGDGSYDLLAALSAGSVAWWHNDVGDGSAWTQGTVEGVFPSASSVSAADLDRDGALDVVATADGAADRVRWWRNAGDGSAWTGVDVAAAVDGARGVTTADLDGDGWVDIAAAAVDAGAVRWWRNAGTPLDGGFVAAEGGGSAVPGDLRSLDLDLDGDLDLVGAGDSVAAWWENGGGAASWTPRPSSAAATATAAADLDGDGDLDLASADGVSDGITWTENLTLHRSARFDVEGTVDGSFDGARAVQAADLDGDGDQDLLGAAIFEDRVAWWENVAGDGSAWTEHVVDGSFDGAHAVRAADVDGDGDLDVLGAAEEGHLLAWWPNTLDTGGGWTRNVIATLFLGANDIFPADLDGDGDLDVLGAAEGLDEITWWENIAGDGSAWTETVIDTTFDRPHSVTAADLDEDGDLDVLASGETADAVTWWENTAGDASAWTEHVIDNSFDGAYSVYAADVDGDGDLDVMSSAQIADIISWWENLGGAAAWTKRDLTFFNQAWWAEAADLDGDGDLDIFGAAFKDGGKISWWDNLDGSGTLWQKTEITGAYDGAGSAHAADVDGDGRLDLITTAERDDQLTWWPNRGGQAALVTLDIAPQSLPAGGSAPIFALDLTPRGKAGEGDAELATLELGFEEAPGDPMTSAQLDGLLDALVIARDNDISGVPGTFDGADIELVRATDFDLDGGVVSFEVPDGAAAAAVPQRMSGRFFVALEVTADLDLQPVSGLRVTHRVASSSRVEDRDGDVPLRLESPEDLAGDMFAINALADLALILGASPDPVSAGGSVLVTATVDNDGPDPAEGTVLTLDLPAGVALVSTSGCAEDPGGVPTCTLGVVPAGGSAQVTVAVAVDVAAGGTLVFDGEVASDTLEVDPGGETAAAGVDVIAQADLGVVLTSSAPEYRPGAPLAFTVEVSNAGPGPADGAFTGAFPAELTGATWTCSESGGGTCPAPSGVGNLDFDLTLPAGAELRFEAVGTVAPGTTGVLSSTATVTADAATTFDGDGGNDGSTVMVVFADPIFVDGFETGDLLGWSTVFP
ncbi:MAG: FG-GAP-like repeat-containing protein [Acidobacteriota bacterium]